MYSIYKMKIFVFDVDNTLILHTNQNIDFYKKGNSKISKLILNTNVDAVYIYTNGTFRVGKWNETKNNLVMVNKLQKV